MAGEKGSSDGIWEGKIVVEMRERGKTTIRAASIILVEERYCRDDYPDQNNIDKLCYLVYLCVESEVEVIVVRMQARHLPRLNSRVELERMHTRSSPESTFENLWSVPVVTSALLISLASRSRYIFRLTRECIYTRRISSITASGSAPSKTGSAMQHQRPADAQPSTPTRAHA